MERGLNLTTLNGQIRNNGLKEPYRSKEVFDRTFQPQLKLLAHGERLSDFLSGRKIVPVNVEVSPCHTCNATCDWCFYSGTHLGFKKGSLMEERIATNLIKEMSEIGVRAITWTGGGEPTLHPEFPQFVRYSREVGLSQGLFTNALLSPRYDPSLFDWIRVSNTDKEWNVEAIKEIRKNVKKLGLAYNYSGDDDAVYHATRVGREVGADYVQIRQALNLRGRVTDRNPPTVNDPLVRITTYKFDESSNPHGYAQCLAFHFTPFVWHNGNVDVCGYHRETGGEYTLGNLSEKSLLEIIKDSPRSVPVREDCQVCCRNHEMNVGLHNAQSLEDENFL